MYIPFSVNLLGYSNIFRSVFSKFISFSIRQKIPTIIIAAVKIGF